MTEGILGRGEFFNSGVNIRLTRVINMRPIRMGAAIKRVLINFLENFRYRGGRGAS
jgi:hypothetical protein